MCPVTDVFYITLVTRSYGVHGPPRGPRRHPQWKDPSCIGRHNDARYLYISLSSCRTGSHERWCQLSPPCTVHLAINQRRDSRNVASDVSIESVPTRGGDRTMPSSCRLPPAGPMILTSIARFPSKRHVNAINTSEAGQSQRMRRRCTGKINK